MQARKQSSAGIDVKTLMSTIWMQPRATEAVIRAVQQRQRTPQDAPRCLVFAGCSGSGKTALALALAKLMRVSSRPGYVYADLSAVAAASEADSLETRIMLAKRVATKDRPSLIVFDNLNDNGRRIVRFMESDIAANVLYVLITNAESEFVRQQCLDAFEFGTEFGTFFQNVGVDSTALLSAQVGARLASAFDQRLQPYMSECVVLKPLFGADRYLHIERLTKRFMTRKFLPCVSVRRCGSDSYRRYMAALPDTELINQLDTWLSKLLVTSATAQSHPLVRAFNCTLTLCVHESDSASTLYAYTTRRRPVASTRCMCVSQECISAIVLAGMEKEEKEEKKPAALTPTTLSSSSVEVQRTPPPPPPPLFPPPYPHVRVRTSILGKHIREQECVLPTRTTNPAFTLSRSWAFVK